MNRRDMIIVAVLMNTGLLAVLFMMAMNTDDGGAVLEQAGVQEVVVAAPPVLSPPPMMATSPPPSMVEPVALSHTSPHDEFDSVITAYATGAASTKPVLIDEQYLYEPVKPLQKAPDQPVSVPVAMGEVSVEKAVEKTGFVDVTVKKGDSLDKIARANGTSVKTLKRTNNLSSDRLQIGQVLRIPLDAAKEVVAKAVKEKPAAKPAAKAAAKSVGSEEFYTLKSGDNPWKIAKMFHVRFDELLKLNKLDEEKARHLKAGDRIRVK